MIQRAVLRVQLLDLVLGKVADFEILRRQVFTALHGQLTGQYFDQGRFTRPVRTKQTNAVTGRQAQVHGADHRGLRIAGRHPVEPQ